jgi:hypothetical protein
VGGRWMLESFASELRATLARVPAVVLIHKREEIRLGFLIKIFGSAVTLLLTLKLLEMIKLIHWAFTKSDSFSRSVVLDDTPEDLRPLLLKWGYPLFPEGSALVRSIGRMAGQRTARFFAGAIFRYPVLMIIAAFLAGVSRDALMLVTLSAVLFVGILVLLSLLLVMRYKLGGKHTVLEMPCIAPFRHASYFRADRRAALQFFISLYLASYVILVCGYGAIYRTLALGFIPGSCLAGIDPNRVIFMQCIYFSTATLLTVGYGDINPEGTIGQLLVTTQMACGFVFLILLVSAFSLSSAD